MLSDTSLNPERCKSAFATKPFMVEFSRQVNKSQKIFAVYLPSSLHLSCMENLFHLEKPELVPTPY